MRFYTPQEKMQIQKHPLFVKYSGNVPEELRHLVYPDEAKPAEADKKGKKRVSDEPVSDGDSN